MKSNPYLRNLRRSFGSQIVVCVGRPSWSEAGIAALVIPDQSSRWTSRGQGDVHCRLGDLATWRLWSWMTAGVTGRALCFGYSSGVSCTSQQQHRGFRLNLRLQNTTSLPWLEEPSKRLLRCHSFESSCGRHIPFPLKTARNQKTSIKYE